MRPCSGIKDQNKKIVSHRTSDSSHTLECPLNVKDTSPKLQKAVHVSKILA
jgi:hypothetical protein